MSEESLHSTGQSQQRRGRWLSVLRWSFRVTMLLLIVLLVVLNLLPAVTDTALVRGAVAGAISDVLNGADVRVGTLRLAPLKERLLVLEDFALAPPGRAGEPVVSLRSAECRWAPRDLRDGLLHVTELTADGLSLRMRQEDGEWDLLSLLPLTDEPLEMEALRLPVPVQVDRVALSDARVELVSPGLMDARMVDVAVHGSGRFHDLLEGRASLELAIGNVTASAGPAGVELAEGLQASARVSSRGARVLASAGFQIPRLAGGMEGVGRIRPFPVEGAVGAEADLNGLELPRLDAYLRAGDFFDDRLSLSVIGGPEYDVDLTNRAAVDFRSLHELVDVPAAPPVSLAGTAVVESRLSGTARVAAGPSGLLEVHNTVTLADVESGAELPDLAVSAGIDEGYALVEQSAQVYLSPMPTGLMRAEVVAGAGSVSGALADVLSASAGDLRGGVTVRVTAPVPSRVAGSGSLSAAALQGESPRFGSISLPVQAVFRFAGDDLLNPDRRTATLGPARVRLGELVPRAWLTAHAADGLLGASVNGGGLMEVGRALELLDGMPEQLRQRLPEVAAEGTVGGVFDLELASPLAAERPATIHVESVADLAGIHVRHAAVEAGLAELRGLAMLDARLDGALLPYGVRAGLGGRAAGMESSLLSPETGEPAASGALDRLIVDISAGVPDVGLGGVTADLSGGAEGIRAALLRQDGSVLQLPPADVEFGGRMAAAPAAGDLSLSSLRVAVPGEFQAELPLLRLKGLGAEELAVEGRFALPDLRALAGRAVALLPGALAESIPRLAGRAEGTLDAYGKIPVVDEVLSAMVAGRKLKLDLLPIGEFYRDGAPVNLQARFSVADLSVLGDVAGTEAGVREVSANGEFAVRDGDVTASAELAVPVMEFAPSPVPLRDFRLTSSFALRDFDSLEEARFHFSGPGEVMEAAGTLSADGLASFRGVPTPAEVLRKLRLEAHSTGAVRPGRLAVVEGLDASGELAWDVEAALEPGDHLAFRIVPELRGVSAGFRSLAALHGLGGEAVFEKRWDIVQARPEPPSLSRDLVARQPAVPGEALRARLGDFGTAVDELLARPQRLVLESASALGTTLVESLRVDVTARGAALSVPRFYLRPLGGKMVGRLSVTPGEGGREVRARGDFGAVDFRLLLPPELRDFSGDATVAGSFAVSAVAAPGTARARNPLKEISGRADVTHVGREALDRLLLALDPRGERPAVVRVRSALKLGSPRRVTARLERGFLSLKVELRGLASGLVSEYSIPRFNIAEAFALPMVTGAFHRLGVALRVLDALDADAIEMAPDGAVRFVRREADLVAREERP